MALFHRAPGRTSNPVLVPCFPSDPLSAPLHFALCPGRPTSTTASYGLFVRWLLVWLYCLMGATSNKSESSGKARVLSLPLLLFQAAVWTVAAFLHQSHRQQLHLGGLPAPIAAALGNPLSFTFMLGMVTSSGGLITSS